MWLTGSRQWFWSFRDCVQMSMLEEDMIIIILVIVIIAMIVNKNYLDVHIKTQHIVIVIMATVMKKLS
jgi:hypothetical protein